MTGERVLVADDDPLSREFLQEALGALQMEVEGAADGEEAIRKLWKGGFDLVVTDLKMPRADGLQVLETARRLQPPVPVVLITAFGTVEVAVEAMRGGAEDFLVKPASPEQVEVVVRRFREKRRLAAENRFLREMLTGGEGQVVAVSPAMKQVLALADKVAPSKATVLITGESGVGKEVVAGRIHARSDRRDKAFIGLNCAALSESLLESELFGHEKGAFTGAVRRREGRFELAHQGTLFLDEIAETGPGLQAKLLRFLEKEEFERVGGSRTLKVDVRILAATNKDLGKAVEEGDFREDLFFRLNVFPIHVPPLRERVEDIPLLVQFGIQKFGKKAGVERVEPSAMEALRAYSWPGNVRELLNVVQRLVLLAEGGAVTRGLVDLVLGGPVRAGRDEPARGGDPFLSLVGKTAAEVEKGLILATIRAQGGNKAAAARILGLTDRTLRNKLRQWEREPLPAGPA